MLKKFKPWEDLTFTDDYMFKLLIERKRIAFGLQLCELVAICLGQNL